jgi:WD40 repeat protein/transcriptional regulator with XRE-family HTH domain
MMADRESFKAWFKQRRKALDLTQGELAQQAGCSIYTVQRIEEGVLRPSRQLGELLAAALAIPQEERAAFVRWARTGEEPAVLAGVSVALADAAASTATPAGNGRIDPALSPSPVVLDVPANPYRGLRAFQEADAPYFFGRESLTRQLQARLVEEGALSRFLAVVGPSGSGKSSVVRAGLVPALRRHLLPGGLSPVVADFVPGTHPLEELEAALLRVAANPPPSLMEQLRADERGLARAVKRVLPGDDRTELVLVIDQFEELFILVPDEEVRQDFIDSLFSAVADPRSRLRVVITLRADFYDRPLLYLPSSELLSRRTEVVGPLTAQEIYAAITGPAERAGLELESSLVATILQDVGEQPGTLPLLQYALTELYERRDGRRLTLAAYQAGGGVFGALAGRAEGLYGALTGAEQTAARQLFLRLVALGEGVEDTRRRVPLSELVSAARDEDALHRVLALYGRYRMLTFDRAPRTNEPTAEVAHEALLHSWGRLRDWLRDSRELLQTERRLLAAADEWQAAGQDASFLARGARLAQFAGLAAESGQPETLALTSEEQAYLAASLEDQRRQAVAEEARRTREVALQKRSANRLRYLVAALTLFLVVATGLALLAEGRQREAQANLIHSEALRLAAEANGLLQTGGPAELAGLLSVHAIRTQYSPQGDAALEAAARLAYPVRRFAGYTDTVWVSTFSPDGKILLAQSDTATREWDVATGRQIAVLPFSGNNLAFSPDGRAILGPQNDGTIRIWDTQALTVTQVLTAPRAPGGKPAALVEAFYSPDGHYIAANGTDKTVRVWDVAGGRQMQVFPLESNLTSALAWSPDSKYIVAGAEDNFARVWDVLSGRLVQSFNKGLAPGAGAGVVAVAYAPDGKTLATDGPHNNVLLWDVATGAQLREFVGHTGPVWSVAFSAGGQTLLTGAGDGTARLWDPATGQQLQVFRGPPAMVEGTVGAAFSPDGTHVATDYFTGEVILWNATRHPDPPILSRSGPVASVAFSADDRTVLTGSYDDRTARLWDAGSGAQLPLEFPGPQGSTVNSAVFSPDGRYVLTANGRPDKAAYIWDIHTGAEVRAFPVNAIVDQAVYSPDGKTVLTGSSDKTARLWDAATGRQLHVLTDTAPVYAVAYAPDGRTVLTGSADGHARLWDVQSGTEIRQFAGHRDNVEDVAYAPDGRRVLTGSSDGTARLWDLQTGAVLGVFSTNNNGVAAVTFAPDGNSILAGSGDGVAHLWDIAGAPTALGWGREIRRFSGHTGAVQAVAFSHDGKYVATGSADGTARLWHTDLQDTLRDLCGLLTRDLTPDERTQYNIADTAPTCPQP